MIQEGFEAIITEVVTSLAFVTNLHVCVCVCVCVYVCMYIFSVY